MLLPHGCYRHLSCSKLLAAAAAWELRKLQHVWSAPPTAARAQISGTSCAFAGLRERNRNARGTQARVSPATAPPPSPNSPMNRIFPQRRIQAYSRFMQYCCVRCQSHDKRPGTKPLNFSLCAQNPSHHLQPSIPIYRGIAFKSAASLAATTAARVVANLYGFLHPSPRDYLDRANPADLPWQLSSWPS